MTVGGGAGLRPRLSEILATVRAAGRVDVADLAEEHGVTTETIRRDLNELQERRLVRRVHGGAIPWDGAIEPDTAAHEGLGAEQKRRIALAAIAELPDHGTIILESGSTAQLVADYFPRDRDVRVVTTSLLQARSLAAIDRVEVYMVGGRVGREQVVSDAAAVDTLRSMRVDVAIMGSDGVDAHAGLTTRDHETFAVKRAIIEASARVVVLADHRKHGVVLMRRFADWDEIDTYVTDGDSDPDVLDAIRATGVKLIVAA